MKVPLESQQHKIKRLNAKIDDLKEGIKRWKDDCYEEIEKNKELMKWLAIAQATWAWETFSKICCRQILDNQKIGQVQTNEPPLQQC